MCSSILEFALVHDAADAGDWAGYVNAQGGPFVRRDDLQVRTLYAPDDEFNQYGETTVRIRGVYDTQVGAGSPVLTRLKKWKIVPKRTGVDLQGAPAPSWSSVNNCTRWPPSRCSDPPPDNPESTRQTALKAWAKQNNGFLFQQHSDAVK